MIAMSVTIDLPDEALRRLQAEADRHGVALDDVIAELAEQLPAETSRPKAKRKLAFVGIGASSEGISDHIDELLADGFGRD